QEGNPPETDRHTDRSHTVSLFPAVPVPYLPGSSDIRNLPWRHNRPPQTSLSASLNCPKTDSHRKAVPSPASLIRHFADLQTRSLPDSQDAHTKNRYTRWRRRRTALRWSSRRRM